MLNFATDIARDAGNLLVQKLGVARHVDAGYEEAEQTAREKSINIPLLHA